MGGFPNIILDPYLVCLPQSPEKGEDLDDFVENLLAWSDLLRREDVKVYFPSSCLEALVEEDQYPYGYKLKQMMGRLGTAHIADDLVCRVAQGVLERTPTLEGRCAMNIAIFDEGSSRVEPEIYITRLAARIGWGLKHGLVVVACFQRSNPDHSDFLLASARSAPKEIFEGQEIEISAQVEAVDFTAPEMVGSISFPLEINDSLPVAFSRRSVLEHLGSLRLWGDAASHEGAVDAINVRVEELLTRGTGNRERRRLFRFGDRFLASARQHGFGSRSDLATNLIDSCARILVDIPKNAVNPFRVSEEATSAQRSRQDGALAYRTHLTKSGAGFRLMYWELKDRTIEFANVGTKFELEIF